MTGDILRALALVIIIEGMLPFVAPGAFRVSMHRLAQLDDRMLRIIGLISMIIGLVGLQVVRWLL